MANSIRVVEIGATNLRRADVFVDGQKVKIENFETQKSGKLTPDLLFEFTKKDLKNPEKIIYITAGPVKNRRIVEMLPNIPSIPRNYDLTGESERILKRSSIVINDMAAAVLGMSFLLGDGRSFWGITWSTGLGGKFFDGEKIAEENLEIGHMIFDNSPEAPLCGCGGRGHIEALISGTALAKKSGKDLSQVTEDYKARKAEAIALYTGAAAKMGELLARLHKMHKARTFVFKGSLAINILELENIKSIVLESMKKNGIAEAVEIIFSPDPEKDAFYGAALI